MRNTRKRLVASIGGLALVVSGVGGGTATAASEGQPGVLACYDYARQYNKLAGAKHYPIYYPGGTWLTTSSQCANINIKPSSTRYVKVCFDPYTGSPYCQSNWKFAPADKWTSVAVDVLNGTRFKFFFENDTVTSTGSYAA